MSGFYDAIVYIILASGTFVFLDNLCAQLSPPVALFIMSGIALVCFHYLARAQLETTYRKVLHYWPLYLTLSIALGIDWLCMIYASRRSDPFVTMTAMFATTSFCGFAFMYKKSSDLFHLLSMGLLVGSLILLHYIYKLEHTKILDLGILLGVMAGLAYFVYMVFSEEICRKADLSTLELLASRFWPLFLGTGLWVSSEEIARAVSLFGGSLVLMSLMALVIPVYFNQQAINKLGAGITAILMSSVPAVTFLFYCLYHGRISMANLFVCIVISLALIIPRLFKR